MAVLYDPLYIRRKTIMCEDYYLLTKLILKAKHFSKNTKMLIRYFVTDDVRNTHIMTTHTRY